MSRAKVVDLRREQEAKYVASTAQRLAGGVRVQVHNTTDDLLAAVPKMQGLQTSDNPSGIAMGDTIHVVLDNINTPRGVVSTILHEAGVHARTWAHTVFQGRERPIPCQSRRKRNAKYKDFVAKLGYVGGADNASEEALAYMYELNGWLTRPDFSAA